MKRIYRDLDSGSYSIENLDRERRGTKKWRLRRCGQRWHRKPWRARHLTSRERLFPREQSLPEPQSHLRDVRLPTSGLQPHSPILLKEEKKKEERMEGEKKRNKTFVKVIPRAEPPTKRLKVTHKVMKGTSTPHLPTTHTGLQYKNGELALKALHNVLFLGRSTREPQSTEKTKTQTLQKSEVSASTASANNTKPKSQPGQQKLHTRSLLP